MTRSGFHCGDRDGCSLCWLGGCCELGAEFDRNLTQSVGERWLKSSGWIVEVEWQVRAEVADCLA